MRLREVSRIFIFDRVKTRLIVLVLLASSACADVADTNSVSSASTISTPWAVVQCSYPDLLAAPYLGMSSMLDALYNDPGDPGNLHSYFALQSGGQVDLSGSMVFGPYIFDEPYDTEVAKSRQQVLGDCLSHAIGDMAALGKTPYDFYGVNAVVLGPSNDGAWTGGVDWIYVPGSPFTFYYLHGLVTGAAHVDGQAPAGDMSFMAHETLHAYGLPHAYDLRTNTEYGDPWDVMSVYSAYLSFEDTEHCIFVSEYDDDGDSSGRKCPYGPNLSAAYRDVLGWLQPETVVDWTPQATLDQELSPIDDVTPQYKRVIRIPANDGVANSRWYIEFRYRQNFDRGVPRPAVLIHYFDGSRQYLVNTVRADGGLLPGDQFVDPMGRFRVRVRSINSSLRLARVWVLPIL